MRGRSYPGRAPRRLILLDPSLLHFVRLGLVEEVQCLVQSELCKTAGAPDPTTHVTCFFGALSPTSGFVRI